MLLDVWLGLRWFEQPSNHRRADRTRRRPWVPQPAFHSGLFILQLLPLDDGLRSVATRNTAPRSPRLYSFAIALRRYDAARADPLGALPRLDVRVRPVCRGSTSTWRRARQGHSRFMAWRPFTTREPRVGSSRLWRRWIIPLVRTTRQRGRVAHGRDYGSSTRSVEAQSPYKLYHRLSCGDPWRRPVAAPVGCCCSYRPLLVYYGSPCLPARTEPERLYYAVVVTFGLALLLESIPAALLRVRRPRYGRSALSGATAHTADHCGSASEV